MKDNGTYTSGAFAKKAHVTKKTLRYYAEHGFLTPSAISENGSRIYSEKDFEAYLEKWKNGPYQDQVQFRYAKTQEEIDMGMKKALHDFFMSNGMYTAARKQAEAEEASKAAREHQK